MQPGQPHQPPGGGGYGAPPGGGNYGAPPAGGNYGAPPPAGGGGPYGAGPPPGAGGAPPEAPAGGAPGGKPDLSVGSLLGVGFERFKANAAPYLVAPFVLLLVTGLFGAIGGGISFALAKLEVPPIVGSLVALAIQLVGVVVELLISIGVMRMFLAGARGEEVSAGMLFKGFDKMVQYCIMAFVAGIACSIGFGFCVIPGYFIAYKLVFAPYYVIDKDMSGIDALKASWNATEGIFVPWLVFAIVASIIIMVAASFFVLPVLVAVPVIGIAQAVFYLRASGEQVA